MTTRPSISQLCPTFLIFCHVQPCILHPAAYQTDILHMCLLASCLGALSHSEYSGLPPHQPSLVNSYLSFLTQLESHLSWEAFPDSFVSSSQSLLCPDRASSQSPALMVPVTGTTIFIFMCLWQGWDLLRLRHHIFIFVSLTPKMVPVSVEALIHYLLKKGMKGFRSLYETVAKVSQSPENMPMKLIIDSLPVHMFS